MKTINTVRRIVAVAVLFFCCATASTFAQVPRIIAFQGFAKKITGAPLNGTFDLTFRLYDVVTNGVSFWTETHTNVTVTQGVFSVPLGSYTALSMPFDEPYWLSIAVDTNPEMSPRVPLLSVPYALNAAAVDTLSSNLLATITNIATAAGSSQSSNILATVTNIVNSQSSSILTTVTNLVDSQTSSILAIVTNMVDNQSSNILDTVTNLVNGQSSSILATVTNIVNVQSSNILATVSNIVNAAGMPSGMIVMWSGSIASIPPGWALCDGSSGTPNLRNRFVVGASQDVGGIPMTTVKGTSMQTGGEAEHVLTIAEMPAHDHDYQHHPTWYFSGSSETGGKGSLQNFKTGMTGGNQPHENCPPFYALAFIKKL